MPLVIKEFLDSCKNCTYDANNSCLVTSPAAGLVNVYFIVANDKWNTLRGMVAAPVDAVTAALLMDPTATATTADNFRVGPVGAYIEYSLMQDAGTLGPKAVEAS